MSAQGKRYRNAVANYDRDKAYVPVEAIALVKQMATSKFDETIELSLNLGIDARKADQLVRGTISLPRGTGKPVRVVVFAQADKAREARDAGADEVGADELAEKISKGWTDFDVVIATPDMMPVVGKLGRILGPRSLMPNPKSGTVTADVAKAVGEIKSGRIEYRNDKHSNVHTVIGKASFEVSALEENYLAVVDELQRVKPSAAKGKYLKSITVSSTMGPGVRIDSGHPRGIETHTPKGATEPTAE
ncbi:MAG: 50S ribosomal protein L1 [Actinomycetota bacterium]